MRYTFTHMVEAKAQLLPLTGLRFFLALWVIIFHQPFLTGYSWMAPFPAPLPSLFHAGYLAVGVFFVLSGFILSYNYGLEGSWPGSQLKKFGAARFARIYPSYCIGLILSAPWVADALAKHFSLLRVLKEIAAAVLTWTLLQAWIPQTADAWNGPGWSLSVEASFYFCFPVVGVALWRLSRPSTLLTAGLLVWASSLIAPLIAVHRGLPDSAGFPAAMWNPDSAGAWTNFIKFNPLLNLPQFCMGIIIGRGFHLLRGRRKAWLGRGYWLYLPGLILEGLVIVRYQSPLYLFLHNGLLLPLHSLVILGFALDGGILARFLSLRPLVFWGNASYSMYIFHMPLAGWLSAISKRLISAKLEGLLVAILYVGVLICFSSIIFKYVEEPGNRMLKRKLISWFDPSTTARPTLVER